MCQVGEGPRARPGRRTRCRQSFPVTKRGPGGCPPCPSPLPSAVPAHLGSALGAPSRRWEGPCEPARMSEAGPGPALGTRLRGSRHDPVQDVCPRREAPTPACPHRGWALPGPQAGVGQRVTAPAAGCGRVRGLAHLRILCLETARVAQEVKRCQTVFWQGPGPKAPGLEGDQGAAALEGHQCFLSAPSSFSVPLFPTSLCRQSCCPSYQYLLLSEK